MGTPVAAAFHALREAGYQPEVIKSYGHRLLPKFFNQTRGRREVFRLTGSYEVPTLVLDDGSVIDGAKQIAVWAQAHPAVATPAP